MKFTCDSCGAQYQIADTKLGAKGVKVRCRKCSYLIILRPKDYEPVARTVIDPMPAGDTDNLGDGFGSEGFGDDSDQPTAAELEPRPGESHADLSTSSDFGISQEFKAMGFDDAAEGAGRGASLSVGLDVARLQHQASDSMSPFSPGASGGSLDDVPRLGASAPPTSGGYNESTRVDSQPDVTAPEGKDDLRALARELDQDDDADRKDTPPPKAKWSIDDDDDGPGLRDEPTSRGLRPTARAVSSAPVSPGLGGERLMNTDSEVGAMLNSVGERNELAEIRSSVESAMVGLSNQLDGWAAGKKPVDSNVTEDEDEDEALGHLMAKGANGNGAKPKPIVAEPASSGESILGTGIEGELGDAFDAMFSPANMSGSDGIEHAGLSAVTEMSPQPPQDKLPTRVFDTEAMAQVQAEQDRAINVVGVQKPKPTPEWYVAIDDAQVGPLTADDVGKKWEDGEISANSLCWKQGMADWTAVRFTDGLKQLLEKVQEQKLSAKLDRRVAEEDEAMAARPPQISMGGAGEAPRAQAAASAKLPDAPTWRPSAASLLASLAAEELSDSSSSSSSRAAAKSDVALGPAIPATSNALEKLLEGSSSPAITPFGPAEKSESAIRPLPRRPDTVSSVPLRDLTPARPGGRGLAVPMAIFGGFAVLAIAVVVALSRGKETPPAPPPPAMAPPVAVAPPPAAVPPAPPPAAVVPPGGTAMAAADTTPPSGEVKREDKGSEAAAADSETKSDADKKKKDKDSGSSSSKKKDRDREPREERREAVSKKVEPPPPPPAKPVSEEDDLLGGALKQTKRVVVQEESSDLPKQLDDSDILTVLRKNRDDVRTCLEKQTAADPTLDGAMQVKMVIEKTGQAKRVMVTPDKFKNTVVGKCVMGKVQGWSFPKFSGPAMPIDFPVHIRGR